MLLAWIAEIVAFRTEALKVAGGAVRLLLHCSETVAVPARVSGICIATEPCDSLNRNTVPCGEIKLTGSEVVPPETRRQVLDPACGEGSLSPEFRFAWPWTM